MSMHLLRMRRHYCHVWNTWHCSSYESCFISDDNGRMWTANCNQQVCMQCDLKMTAIRDLSDQRLDWFVCMFFCESQLIVDYVWWLFSFQKRVFLVRTYFCAFCTGWWDKMEHFEPFLARDVFVRANRRTIVRLSLCSSVRLFSRYPK